MPPAALNVTGEAKRVPLLLEQSPASSTRLLAGVSGVGFEPICQCFRRKADRPLPLGSAGGLY